MLVAKIIRDKIIIILYYYPYGLWCVKYFWADLKSKDDMKVKRK